MGWWQSATLPMCKVISAVPGKYGTYSCNCVADLVFWVCEGLESRMEVRHDDSTLEQVEFDKSFTAGYAPAIVKSFRKTMNSIRAAVDERDIRERRAARFEKLSGNRSHQHSIRLNDQYRLIIELEGEAPNKTVVIVGIEDYH